MKRSPTAAEIGRKGGRAKSEAKTRACRRNAVISAYLRKQRKQAENALQK